NELDMASRVDPENAPILRKLAELARDGGELERAEKSYRALLVVLRRQGDAVSSRNIARSEVLVELSSIAERRGNPDRAREILETAIEAGAQSALEQARLEAALCAHGNFDALVRVLEAKLAAKSDSADAARALTDIVSAAVDIGDARTEARRDADLASALAMLAEARERGGDLRDAIALKRKAAAHAEPEVARRLTFDAGRLAADGLDDLPLAADTYRTLHEAHPADREWWQALADVYRRLGDSAQLAALIGSVIDSVDDVGERGRLRLERVDALLASQSLTDAEVVPLLREIVDEDPGQVDAAWMLAGILETAGANDELADLLARQIEAAKDRGDAESVAALAARLGPLIEASGYPLEARSLYYMGLDWEPNHRELLDALLALLSSHDDPVERADVLERRLAIECGPEAESMAIALADAREQVGDEMGVERAWALGYERWPASRMLRDRLEVAYRARGAWQHLADLYAKDAETLNDDDAQLLIDAIERG
ncbi:MAG: hypothetical protein FWD17_19460, partial [Polyangiaceae bacterium]|nr:hypothetical protein [Polyangiaceae bacterium]